MAAVGGTAIGDLVVTAVAPDGAFNEPNPLTGNHGGPQTRDNFFAVIGGGPLVRRQAIAGAVDPLFDDTERNPGQAENVDVAPTVTRLLGERAPAAERGALPGRGVRPSRAAGRRTPPAGRRARRARASRGLPLGVGAARAGAACASAFRAPRSRGVTVDVFQSSIGRRILGNRRIARFTGRRKAFLWRGRGARDGQLFARLRVVRPAGAPTCAGSRSRAAAGASTARPAFYRRASCGAITSFKLERPVFGGRTNRAVDVTYRLGATGRVRLELLRGKRVVRRLAPTRVARGRAGAPRADRVGGPARAATTGCG